jgi:hypothetical protein
MMKPILKGQKKVNEKLLKIIQRNVRTRGNQVRNTLSFCVCVLTLETLLVTILWEVVGACGILKLCLRCCSMYL